MNRNELIFKINIEKQKIAEGFPVIFVGRKALIVRSKVDEWLENNISKCF